ncbi:MAG: FkbM family methyltransferase [Candidatus Omnitrophota bacterium]
MTKRSHSLRKFFLKIRAQLLPFYHFGYFASLSLRYNPYTGFLGRRLFPYLPFLLPHDKSYYGFLHLADKEEGLFLDVGANDGISALGFRHINKNYSILSIEPNLCHEPALLRLRKKLKKFDYMTVAAGSENAEAILYIPLYKGIPIHSASSFRKDFIENTMEKQFPGHDPRDLVCLQHIVNVIRLDDLKLRPDIIKIDTEGHDYKVLLGLQDTIKNHRPHIVFEFSPEDIDLTEDLLKRMNYDLLVYHYPEKYFLKFDKQAIASSFEKTKMTVNIFCIPQEKKGALPISSNPGGPSS